MILESALSPDKNTLQDRPISFSDGSHMVGLYTIEENVLRALIPFLVEGLTVGDRCFYAAPTSTIKSVRKRLQEAGILVAEAEEKGQLILLDQKDPLLNQGHFDPEYLVKLYQDDIDNALEEGWPHVRATAEMSWLIEGEDGREKILYYEALSTKLFNNTAKVHALCQYKTSRMNGNEIIELLKIHPWALIDGQVGENPYWTDPTPDLYAPQTKN